MRDHHLGFGAVPTIGLSLLVLLTSQAVGVAGPPRYTPAAGSTIVYNVEITATLPSEIETYKGVICYKVTAAGDPLRLTYEGGVSKSVRAKPGSESDPFDFPPFPVGPSFGPFAQPLWQGVGNARNQLTLSPQGAIRELAGESHLPFLVGNLSLLVFEPLPEADEKSWTDTSKIGISEHNSPRFPMRPFANNDPKKVTAGSESVTLTFEGDQGDIVKYRKTYSLNMPGTDETININGNGVWTFNRRLGVPESLDYTATYTRQEQGVTVAVPLTIKYERMSEEHWAKLQQQRKERAEQAQKEAEVRRNTPLSETERETLVNDLGSGSERRARTALGKLKHAKPEHNQAIVDAARRLIDHPDRTINRYAREVAARFSPDFEANQEINKKYASHMPLGDEDVGPPVTPSTPLPEGLIVAYRDEHGHGWRAGRVVGTMGDDQVVVRCPIFDRTTTCPRSDVRLAPPGVIQLARGGDAPAPPREVARTTHTPPPPREAPPKTAAPAGDRDYRVWTDSSGTFTIMAKFLGVDGENVRLERKQDNKVVKVPLDRLSDKDRQVVDRLHEPPLKNPFDP